MDPWTCTCTAINQTLAHHCWRCKAARPQSDKTSVLDTLASSDLTIRDIMLPYLGTAVAVNFDAPARLQEAFLVAVHSQSFAVSAAGSTDRHHFPFARVLCTAEKSDPETPTGKVPQIEVCRQVCAKGGFSVGMSVPL